MTPEQAREAEILRLKIAIAEAESAKAAPEAEKAPAISAKPKKKATALDKTMHVIKGQGELARGMLDVGPIILKGARWVAERIPPSITVPGTGGLPVSALASKAIPVIEPVTQNRAVKPFFDRLSANEVSREDYPLVDAARTFGQWANPVGSGSKVTSKLNYIPAIAATGGEFLGDVFDKGAVGEIVGGISGAVAATRGAGGTPAARRAAEFIRANIGDEGTKAVADAALRGERGTLADLSGKQSGYDIESALTTGPENLFKRQVADEAAARAAAIREDAASNFGSADPILAQEAARQREANRVGQIGGWRRGELNAADEAAQQQASVINQLSTGSTEQAQAARIAAQEAEMRAQQAAGLVATELRPAQTSASLARSIGGARDAASDAASLRWDAFEAGDRILIGPVQRTISDLYNSLDPILKQMFNEKHGKDFRYLVDLAPTETITPREYQAVVKDLKSVANKEITSGGYTTLPEYTRAMDSVVTAANPEFAAARESTTDLHERFPKPVADALDAPPELFVNKLGAANERGSVLARTLQNTGADVGGNVFEHLKALGRAEGITDRFLNKYSHLIDTLAPEQRAAFSNYVESANANTAAQQAAEAAQRADNIAQTQAAKRESALVRTLATQKDKIRAKGEVLVDAVGNTLISKYGKNPKATLSGIVKDPNGADTLRTLGKKMDSLGQGDSFRASIGEQLTDKLLSGDKEAMKVLADSGVLSTEAVNNIQRTANSMKSMEQRNTAIRQSLSSESDEMAKLGPSFASALALQGLPGGHSLIMAGALRRFFQKHWKGVQKPADVAKLEEFMMNPQSYIDALGKIKSAEDAGNKLAQLILSKSPNIAKEETGE